MGARCLPWLALLGVLLAGCATGPSDRPHSVEIRLAQDAAVPGYAEMRLAKDRVRIYVSPEVLLTEHDLLDASVIPTPRRGRMAVALRLSRSGARRLARATKKYEGLLAVLVEGRPVVAPNVKGKTGRSILLSGDFSKDEAERLALALKGGAPLPQWR